MNKLPISFLHRLLLTLVVLCLGINVYAEDTEIYTLLKDANLLKAGEKIILVYSDDSKKVAMSSTQNYSSNTATNRSGVDVEITNNTIETSKINGVQVLTLCGKAGSWSFYTGTAYLYTPGTSAKRLSTASTNTSGNTNATITIDASYNAKIKFNYTDGSNTVYTIIKYYTYFSCYGESSSAKAIQIYHLVKVPTTSFAETSVDIIYGNNYSQAVTTNSNGTLTYSSSDESIATVDNEGNITALKNGTVTITANTAENSDYAASTASYTLNIKYPDEGIGLEASDTIFYESFNTNLGTGGNDDSWSGTIASSNIKADKDNWTFESCYGASKCIRIGNTSSQGSATTPALNQEGNFIITFKAGAWKDDSQNMIINIGAGEGSLSATSITLKNNEFTNYIIALTGASNETKITFQSLDKKRVFLDSIKIIKIISNRYEGNNTVTKSMITAAPDVVDNALTVIKTKDSSIIPDGIKNATNVIVGNESTYTAKKIVLTDKKDYYAPFGFTAETLTYSRSNTQGFNTVCLPFDFNVNDAKKLFGGDAKVYALTGVENASGSGTSLTFGDATGTIKAGTPCLIYNETTTDWNITLDNVEMNGTSSEESVTPSEDGVTCNFTGSYQVQTLGEGYYKLNSTGSKFVTTTESSTIKPFRAYLKIQ